MTTIQSCTTAPTSSGKTAKDNVYHCPSQNAYFCQLQCRKRQTDPGTKTSRRPNWPAQRTESNRLLQSEQAVRLLRPFAIREAQIRILLRYSWFVNHKQNDRERERECCVSKNIANSLNKVSRCHQNTHSASNRVNEPTFNFIKLYSFPSDGV